MKKEIEKLIEDNLDLPVKVARKIAATKWVFKSVIDFDDLVSEGNIGLIDAANKYDSEKATSGFRSYAAFRIKGAILDFFRRVSWAKKQAVEEAKESGEPLRTITCVGHWTNDSHDASHILNELDDLSYSEYKNASFESSDTIDYLFKYLSDTEQKIAKMYYIDYMTMLQIGNELGYSEAGICLKLKKIKHKCTERLESLQIAKPESFNVKLI